MFEKCIDNMLPTVPPLVEYFRRDSNRKDMQYKEPNDVVFGYIWGAVSAAVLPMLLPFSLQQNTPVEETFEEVRRMLEVRSAEFQDNITKTA
jgi:hypothetical protein